MNDPLYNHEVFGPTKGKGGVIGKSDEQLIQDLIAIHNAENWLGMDGDAELSMFNSKDTPSSSSSSDSYGGGCKNSILGDLDGGRQSTSPNAVVSHNGTCGNGEQATDFQLFRIN